MGRPALPVVVAHRGYPKDHPENTIAACQAAVDAGARWVEIDVQMHDGRLVLAHDLPTDGREPSLSEFAEWLEARPKISALVEMKQASLSVFGIERVVLALLKTMRGNWHPISFNHQALQLAVDKGSPAPGWVVCRYGVDVMEKAKAIGARWLITNRTFLPQGQLPAAPCDWMVYEVNDPAEAAELDACGVGWIETKEVELMLGSD